MRHQRLAAHSVSDQESRQLSSGLLTRPMPKKSVDEAAGQRQTAREAPVQESGFRANVERNALYARLEQGRETELSVLEPMG